MTHRGPEHYLKELIKKHLARLHANGHALESPPPYTFMPVPTGYGKRTIDFLIAAKKVGSDKATFLGIETKAPGKTPTAAQTACMREIEEAGGVAFWCDNFSGYLMNMYVNGFIPIPRGAKPELEYQEPRGKDAMKV